MKRRTGSKWLNFTGQWRVSTETTPPIELEFPARQHNKFSNVNQTYENPYIVSTSWSTVLTVDAAGQRYNIPYPTSAIDGDTIVVVTFSEGYGTGTYPPGWTLAVNDSGSEAWFLRVTPQTSRGPISYHDSFGNEHGFLVIVIRNLDQTETGSNFYLSTTTNNIDPAALSPSWAGSAGTFMLACAHERRNLPLNPVTGYPSGYTNTQTQNFETNPGVEAITFGIASKFEASAGGSPSFDPSAFTFTTTTTIDGSFTLAFRSKYTGELRVRTNYRVAQPQSAYTNSQTHYAHTVNVSTGITLVQSSKHTNTNTFQTHTLRMTMKPSLYTDGDTIQSLSIRRTLRPSLYTDPDTFQTQTLRRTLKPAIYTDPDTFQTQSIRRTLRPSLYADPDAFQTHTLRMTVKPTLYSDGDTFYTHALAFSGGGVTISPPLHTNAQGYFTHSIRVTLKPAVYTDPDAFQTQVIRRTLKPTNYVDPDTFQTQTLRRTLKPTNYTNAQAFQTHKLLLKISPAAYANPQGYFTHTILLAGAAAPLLYVNSQTFYGHTVIVAGASVGGSGPYGRRKKKRLVIPAYEDSVTETTGRRSTQPKPVQAGERPPPSLPADLRALAAHAFEAVPVSPEPNQARLLWEAVLQGIMNNEAAAATEQLRQLEAEIERQLELEEAQAAHYTAVTKLAEAYVEANSANAEAMMGKYHELRRKREADEERFLILAAMELLRD